MATSVPANPEVMHFIRYLEADYRVARATVDMAAPWHGDEYGISIKLPRNWFVSYSSPNLKEAKRYFDDHIEGWYLQADTAVTDMKLIGSEAKLKGNSESPSDPKRKANT